MPLRAPLSFLVFSLTARFAFEPSALADESHPHGPVLTSRDPYPRQVASAAPAADKKDEKKDGEQDGQKPDGSYFVRRKDDGSGAVYEVAIPWTLFARNGATINPQAGPTAGLSFGLDLVLTEEGGGILTQRRAAGQVQRADQRIARAAQHRLDQHAAHAARGAGDAELHAQDSSGGYGRTGPLGSTVTHAHS